jgi:AI-2 transport protein TqsA
MDEAARPAASAQRTLRNLAAITVVLAGLKLGAGRLVPIAFLQHDPLKSLLVAAGYLVIGVLLGNLVEPALLGSRLGLSTLAVFLSLVVWGWLWGPLGMFLSVPLTMALKMALGGSGEWGWLAVLLDAPPRARASAEPAPALANAGSAAAGGGGTP